MAAKGPEGARPVGALAVDAGLRVGSLDLDVRFRVEPGKVVGLLGPNGAGKTTLLHAVAGLRKPTRGRIRLGGADLDDVEAGVHRPPARRSVGVVFQDYLLFPHLSARENVAFGPRARGLTAEQARSRADEWLRRLHAADVAGQKPSELSGGEAQRVALARALATEPDLLLLDEPFSALDAQARLDVRRELTGVLRRFPGPAVLVTHDPLEAAGLADRLLILEGGRISQEGTVEEVSRRPRSPWVARLLGLNFVRGRGSGREVALESGLTLRTARDVSGTTACVFEPGDVVVELGGDEGAEAERPNRWRARIRGVESLGSRLRLHLEGPMELVAELSPAAGRVEALAGEEELRVSIPPERIRTFPG